MSQQTSLLSSIIIYNSVQACYLLAKISRLALESCSQLKVQFYERNSLCINFVINFCNVVFNGISYRSYFSPKILIKTYSNRPVHKIIDSKDRESKPHSKAR